jgi:hypothetical protein
MNYYRHADAGYPRAGDSPLTVYSTRVGERRSISLAVTTWNYLAGNTLRRRVQLDKAIARLNADRPNVML